MSDRPTLKLTKRIPARTHTIKAFWCRKDFMEMSDTFRQIRKKCRTPMNTCHWCGHSFPNGEMMSLAAFEKGGNKVLCQCCADALLASATQSPKGESHAPATATG
jgi:hypothetical protein